MIGDNVNDNWNVPRLERDGDISDEGHHRKLGSIVKDIELCNELSLLTANMVTGLQDAIAVESVKSFDGLLAGICTSERSWKMPTGLKDRLWGS
jgi:hypothetical protein